MRCIILGPPWIMWCNFTESLRALYIETAAFLAAGSIDRRDRVARPADLGHGAPFSGTSHEGRKDTDDEEDESD